MNNLKIPQISRITKFEANETIQIFGENFTEKAKVYWWRPNINQDTDRSLHFTPDKGALPKNPPEDAILYKADNVCDGQVLFVAAEKNKIYEGAAVMWVETEEGISEPVVANNPEIWFKSQRVARPEEIISVYGNGFWQFYCRSAVLKKKGTEEYIPAVVKTPNDKFYYHDAHRYVTYVEMPKGLDAGDYELYVHCGYGGQYGWSNSIDISIEKEYTLTEYYRTKWSRETSVEIPLPKCNKKVVAAPAEGAFVDMTDAIQSACDEMEKSGGGIVILTAGTYGISRAIRLRKGVVIHGAGKGATTIRTVYGSEIRQDWDDVSFFGKPGEQKAIDWKPFWQKHRNGVLIRIYGDSGIDGVTLEINGAGIGVLLSGDTQESDVCGAFINNCNIDGAGTNTFFDYGMFGSVSGGIISTCRTRDLVIYKCHITALKTVELLPSRNDYAKVVRNVFETSPRQMDHHYFGISRKSLFIENDFIGGIRGFICQGGFSENWMYQNRTEDVNRAANALELYMSEYGRCFWSGYANSLGENYIEVDKNSDIFKSDSLAFNNRDGAPISESDKFICIMDGRGFGQYRKVIGVEENRIILDSPWKVKPDSTTYFTFVQQTWHSLFVDNGTAMTNGHTQFLWLGGIENVIAGQSIDLSAGIRLHNHIVPDKYEHCHILAFNYILHSQVRASGKGFWFDTYSKETSKHPSILRTKGVFGNSVRWNVFDGMHSMHYTKNLPEYVDLVPHAGVAVSGAYNTFANNRIGGYKTGVKFTDCYSHDNFFEKTVFEDVAVRFGGHGKPIGPDAVYKD